MIKVRISNNPNQEYCKYPIVPMFVERNNSITNAEEKLSSIKAELVSASNLSDSRIDELSRLLKEVQETLIEEKKNYISKNFRLIKH